MNSGKDKAAYKIVREDIVADILSGIYPVGSAIKGQEFYADKFKVSRTTVRRAFDNLVDKGLLYTVKGKGTYVKSRTAFLTTEPKEQSQQERSYPQASFKLVQLKVGGADKRIAKQLQISEGAPVVCIERIKFVDGVAGNYQTSYLNMKLVENVNFMSEDLENGSLYRLLIHKAKLVPHHSDETIRALPCPEEISKHFNMEPQAPILFIIRVTYAENGAVMEYCEDYEETDVKGLKRRCYHDKEDDYKRHRWYPDRE